MGKYLAFSPPLYYPAPFPLAVTVARSDRTCGWRQGNCCWHMKSLVKAQLVLAGDPASPPPPPQLPRKAGGQLGAQPVPKGAGRRPVWGRPA